MIDRDSQAEQRNKGSAGSGIVAASVRRPPRLSQSRISPDVLRISFRGHTTQGRDGRSEPGKDPQKESEHGSAAMGLAESFQSCRVGKSPLIFV